MSRWDNRATVAILIVMMLSWLSLGCQSVTQAVEDFTQSVITPEAQKDWPHSAFVPMREIVQVETGNTLLLESHHVSPAGLQQVAIFVNNEPLNGEASSDSGSVFAYKSDTARILVDAPLNKGNAVEPDFPYEDWTVSLIWVGQVPGTYALTLVATDTAGHQGNPITQRIEVKEVTP